MRRGHLPAQVLFKHVFFIAHRLHVVDVCECSQMGGYVVGAGSVFGLRLNTVVYSRTSTRGCTF